MPLIIQAEKGPSTEEAIETAESSPQRLLTRTIALGIAASIAGTLVAGFPKIVNIDTEFPKLFSAMLATAVASLAIISALIGFYRVRESQQETSTKADTLSSLMTFEREVVDLFTSVGARIQASTTTAGYDLNVDHNGRKILVEIKAWKRPMPVRLIALVVEQLRQAVESEHAAEGIIVIARSMRFPREIIGQGIKIMTLPELRNYLAHVQQK